MGLALHQADGTQGSLPPMLGWYPQNGPAANNGYGTVFFHLLPFVEQQNLYQSTRNVAGAFDVSQGSARQTRVSLFLNPLDPSVDVSGTVHGLGACGYGANFQVLGRT